MCMCADGIEVLVYAPLHCRLHVVEVLGHTLHGCEVPWVFGSRTTQAWNAESHIQ